ncbi:MULTISPECIES: DUF2782 domain-containing protein [Marinobacter]|uniref:DUF2782 domain-containing protein n=1 Tax=Marinobacter segnicrescens TaxID=430453 RepID=A0A1I0F9Y8_9GAMM|nr:MULTISPECIES: DUF2782 domain-containing protein [Marinobacter]UZD65175.1 DUF2782 domain-containing protein [Marinobacter sp. AN1]SET54635.1 Protein of unknown function [Marinobacter segnicrescens]
MKPVVISLLALCLAAPASVLAQDASGSPLDEKPQMPDEPVVIPEYEPQTDGSAIVIRPGDDVVYYEYRVNGQLREIKVVPEVGPAYYLVPADGGGWIREDETSLLIPSWVLFRW